MLFFMSNSSTWWLMKKSLIDRVELSRGSAMIIVSAIAAPRRITRGIA